MDYSPSIRMIMNFAAQEAIRSGYREIGPDHIFVALLIFGNIRPEEIHKTTETKATHQLLLSEIEELRSLCTIHKITLEALLEQMRTLVPQGQQQIQGNRIHRSLEAKKYFSMAEAYAKRTSLKFVTAVYLFQSLLENPPPAAAAAMNEINTTGSVKGKDRKLQQRLGALLLQLRSLRTFLMERVIGQDHAVHAFVEGLFNAEVVASADEDRKRPKALFVFAGPPGVGKTFLAETAAVFLKKPFKRFDMSGYSDDMGVLLLTGTQRSFKDAKPGQLTGFAAEHPDAFLLFDEIEKASLPVIHLFLQLLDNGTLEDKFTEKTVSFKNCIILFTTNAGREIYSKPNATGLHVEHGELHRQIIIDALKKEVNQRTREPLFPEAICSRMATGYPLMFNHLGVSDLARITENELRRVGSLVEKQYGLGVAFGDAIPLCLVMREGVFTDARNLRSQAESFIKTELFKLFSLFQPDKLPQVLDKARRIIVDLDPEEALEDDVASVLNPSDESAILLASNPLLTALWMHHFPQFDFKPATDLFEARQTLLIQDIDLILLDLRFDNDTGQGGVTDVLKTEMFFDHVPFSARSLKNGQELLRCIHDKHPEIPCFLLSFATEGDGSFGDEDLVLTGIRQGGARGVLRTAFYRPGLPDDQPKEQLALMLSELVMQNRREKMARSMGFQNKVLSFDTTPQVDDDGEKLFLRLRNLRISQTYAADDAGYMLSDMERPTIVFSDVFGAQGAKGELAYIVEWLKDPKRHRRLGLRPPRGILLHGPPGTGKTLLARALAGESNVPFIVESATNFVTKWVGSGPENIRNLFNRARKYAPSILFIDEIDAIGRKRSGEGHGRSQEETLNSLLVEMDGFGVTDHRPVIVVAATNLLDKLDLALIRRFDRAIEVDRPDRVSRLGYLKKYLQGNEKRQVSDAILEQLAGQTVNMTIADLERLIQFAGRKAIKNQGIINDAIIDDAFETTRMGEIQCTTNAGTLLRVARHEAGHCLVGWLRGEKPVQISIVSRGGTGGFVERQSDEDKMLHTKEEILGWIRQALGGRAAEIVFYGAQEGLSTGARADLEAATRYAELMVCCYGMVDRIGPMTITENSRQDGPVALRIMVAVRKVLQHQLDQAVRELEEVKPKMDRLVEELMERNRLTARELEEVIGPICLKPG